MKFQTFIFLIYTVVFIPSFAQEIDEEYVKQHYTKIEEYIPMRDGTKLFTSIYIPKNTTKKHPILLNRTPYTVAPYSIDKYKSSLGNFPQMTAEEYIFVYQDVRGKWMSEGFFENIRPIRTKDNRLQIDESTDTYDTIDWLVKNIKNNNGKVGMYGISYPGFYSTASLIDSHPALKAVSPQAPVTDWFIGDDFRHGGALFLMDAFRFMYTFDAPRPVPVTNTDAPKGFSLTSKDWYKFFLNNPTLKDIKKDYLNHTVRFWDDLAKHSALDSFWINRSIIRHLSKVKPAVMIVGGLYDAEDTYGAFETYKQIEKRNKNNNSILVMGPWFHGGWVRDKGDSFGDVKFDQETSTHYQNYFERPFFEYYLKGTGSFHPAEANIFLTGSNKWQQFEQWPPRDIQIHSLFLTKNNKLVNNLPLDSSNTYIEYTSDPAKPIPFQEGVITERTREYMIADQRFTANRPDVVVFETEELKGDLTVVGPIQVNLNISMTGTDADFIAKIIDVYPDTTTIKSAVSDKVTMQGYQMLVRGEVLRGRFRNSFSSPEPFKPNTVTAVTINLPDVAHTFKKGHKLMVQIQNTWFPLVDRNTNQYMDIWEAQESDFVKNTFHIYTSQKYPSNITFSTLDNK